VSEDSHEALWREVPWREGPGMMSAIGRAGPDGASEIDYFDYVLAATGRAPNVDGIGLDQDRDFKAIYLNAAGDGPAMVNDGRAAALWGGGLGWPGFETVAKSPIGARFIAPTADEIETILVKYSFLRRLTVPANSYPGQNSAISSLGSWSFVLARSTLSDDVAYRLARSLHRGESALQARQIQARETTAVNTIAAAPNIDLIHPGVLRYFHEIGLIR